MNNKETIEMLKKLSEQTKALYEIVKINTESIETISIALKVINDGSMKNE